MYLQPLAIDGVFRATPSAKAARTFDWYRDDVLAPALPAGWRPTFGTTHTALPGQVDGLHLQTGHRVVTCVAGRVALVVVDLRQGAPTFRRWIPLDLDPVNRVTVVIPPESAWGYQAFTPHAAVLSLHRGEPDGVPLDPADPALAISWPLPVASGSKR